DGVADDVADLVIRPWGWGVAALRFDPRVRALLAGARSASEVFITLNGLGYRAVAAADYMNGFTYIELEGERAFTDTRKK
ncbi:MAG: hypothetical protein P1V36_00005, partial [Planctomycetota bacterium]|nr:hypothetical protein [Planctomycetota bacterium]